MTHLTAEPAHTPPTFSRPRGADIQRRVAERFRVPLDEMLSPCRTTKLVLIRWASMYLCVRYSKLSKNQIARLHGRDHATMINGIRKLSALIASADTKFTRRVRALDDELSAVTSPIERKPPRSPGSVIKRPTLDIRIDAALNGQSKSFRDLACQLFPCTSAHRPGKGGSPICYATLSTALQRGGFEQVRNSSQAWDRTILPRRKSS